MKKETVTQKSLWECPNCGAPRVANESNCRFCGSALVMRTVVTEEMTKESVDRQFIIDNSHPTIVSELKPAWITEPTRLVLLLVRFACADGVSFCNRTCFCCSGAACCGKIQTFFENSPGVRGNRGVRGQAERANRQ